MDVSEIQDHDRFKAWLRNKPAEWAQVLAARCALRVAPLAWSVDVLSEDVIEKKYRENLMLMTFRANFISSAAHRYPADDMKGAAAFAVIRAAAFVGARDAVNAAARAAARAVADDVADAVAHAADAAANAAVIWEGIRADCAWLEKHSQEKQINAASNVQTLVNQPLWMKLALPDTLPNWAKAEFHQFNKSDLAQTTSFGLITDWYRSVLQGKPSPFSKEAEIAIAKMSPDDWGDNDKERDCVAVMDRVAEIAGWGRAGDGVVGDGVDEKEKPFFSIIRSATEHSWTDNKKIKQLPRGRVFEYTSPDITERLKLNKQSSVTKLLDAPVLFVLENGVAGASKIGKISNFSLSNSNVHFEYDFDNRVQNLPNEVLLKLEIALGIHGSFAQNRTHWSVHDGDLFELLAECGLVLDGDLDKPLEKDLSNAVDVALQNVQPQTPASFRFGWESDKIVTLSPENQTSDSAFANDMFEELKRKSNTLLENLEQKNADQRAILSIKGLLDVLPDDISDLRPGLLRSRTRSLEADAIAYSEPKGELELFPGAVAIILDAVETSRDLQGCYPQIRDIEAEIVAIGIEPDKTQQVADDLDKISEAISTYEEISDQDSLKAINTVRSIADENAPANVRQKRVAEYALVVRNFLSMLVRVGIDNAFTRASKKFSSDAWEKARPRVVDGVADGIGSMAKPATIVSVAALIGVIFGPIAGVAAAAAGFGKIDRLMQLAHEWLKQDTDDDNKDQN